jgi:uncharacterized protein YlaI
MIVIENNYNTVKEFICPGCKSVLGISVEDFRHDIDGDTNIQCPLCKRVTYVDEKDWFKRKNANK